MSSKDLYESLMNKYKSSGGAGSQKNPENNSSGHNKTYQALMKKYNPEVNEDYVNRFIKDADSFFGKYGDEVGYITGRNIYDQNSDTLEDLNTRARILSRYLNDNADQYENQDQLTESIASITSSLEKYGTFLKGQQDYYSQFESENDWSWYEKYHGKSFDDLYGIMEGLEDGDEKTWLKNYAGQVDYEDKKNYDVDAAQKEIDDLKQRRAEISRTKRPTGSSYLTGDSTLDSSPYGAGLQDSGFDQELADLDKLITQKKQYLNQARHIQEGTKLSGVADKNSQYYDPSFESNSGYATTIDPDPEWWQSGVGDTQYEWINNQNGFRDEYESSMADLNAKAGASSQSDFYIGPSESVYYQKNYDHMNSSEVAIYNYYYATEGKEKAQEYLDSIQESLNLSKATAMFADMDDKTFQEMIFGVEAGLDQFKSGMASLLNTEDEYIPQSAVQMASGMVREDLVDKSIPVWYNFAEGKWEDKVFGSSVGQVAYDAVTTTANMAPSILASMAVGMFNPMAGKITGNLLMGASAAGNAYQDALNRGFDKDQARTYSYMIGGSEAILGELLGGISKLGGTSQFVTNMLNGVDDAFLRFAGKWGGSMVSEGLEEGLQEILSPMFENMYLFEDKEVNWSEVAYSALLGALTAGVMEGPTTLHGEVKTYKTGRQLQAAGITAQRLAEVGNTFAADTVAYQLAGRVDENTGAYTLGRLFNEIGATLTEQNLNDITNALVKEGMSDNVARANARALAAVVEGGNLTDLQVKIIESNDVLAKAAISTIIDPNSTVLQRNKGYNEMLMALAKEKTASDASKANPAATGQVNQQGADNVDAEKESGAESLSGADGAGAGPVKVSAVAAIKDGKVTIKLEDGTEVDIKEADLDPDEGVRIETIAGIEGISASDASYILGVLKATPGASAQVDSLGAVEAYKYGFYGFSQDHITKHGVFANALSKTQRDTIYETGRKARQQQVDNKNATVAKKNATVAKKNATTEKSSTTGIYFDAGGGNVVEFHEGYKFNINVEGYENRQKVKRQAAGFKAAMVLRKLGIGGDIYFFESYRNSKNQLVYKDKNGNEIKAPNGWYEKDGSIHIDLNAGNGGEGVVLFTMAHELTHFIQQWSDQKYKVLADFLTKEYEKGQSMDGLVRAKQKDLSKLRDKEISYDEAYDEVIADSMQAMLADGNVLDKLIELKQTDNSLFMKMKQFFDNLVAKIRSVYKNVVPYTDEGKMVLAMGETVENIQQLFAEALVEASDNFRSAVENVVEANSEPVAAEEIITDGAVVTDGEGTKYSIRSMKHDITEGQMFEDLKKYCGWSQNKVNELRKNLSDLVEYMTPYRDILDMNETYDREERRFSPYKPNSDPLYTISMDFSTLCSKRLLTQYVIENLQLRENRPMSAEEQMAIRDMLNEYRKVEKGLQVACAMCYVEAARLKSPKQITKWMTDPETQMRNYFADKDPEFSAYIKEKQADFKESRGYPRNAKKKDMSAKDVRELNKIRPRLRTQYEVSDAEAKIIERAKELPNSTYLTAGNLAALSESDPTIYAAYTAFVRTATRSKSLETDEPYYYGDSTRDNGNGIVVSDSFIESVNRENGMRFSSWSDWRIQHLLDFITAVIDNSVRGAAMHGYTKFGDEVRVLGKTGMMFNMSGVAGTQTGLNEDGSLSFSSTESIDANEAIQLREEFPDTAGLQCIGVGDDHIVALLRSDIIDYVIPYHTSGLNAGLRRMANIHGWKDYTTTQHAAIDKSIKFENAVDKEHWREEPVYSEFFVGYDTGMTGIEAMRASAERYVQMCKDRGLKPKFEQFVKEDNYWKLLIDRKMVNQKTGKLIQQKPVTPTFDFDTVKSIVDKYVQNYDSGLEARALNHIVENWDSIPKRIRDLKKQGGIKAKKTSKAVDTLANQTLAAQPSEDGMKMSSREIPEGLTPAKYNALLRKKPIKYNPKYWAKVNSPRMDRYAKLSEEEIPELDIFSLAEYGKLNEAYLYYVRNYDKINFAIIGRYRVIPEKRAVIREEQIINDENNSGKKAHSGNGADGAGRGTDSGDGKRSGNGTQLRENDHRTGTNEQSFSGSDSVYGAPDSRSGIKRSDRDTESVSNRSLLVNAFEGVVQNDIEKRRLQEYKDKIDLINAEEQQLQSLNEQIKELSFAKGPKDTKAIRDLQFEAMQTANRIGVYDKQLLRLEASKPLQNVLEREKKMAYQRAEQKGKEALAAYREKATKTQRQMMDRYKEARERANERREKTAMRHKIQNIVGELNNLLLNGDKKRHVPENLKKAVADALALVNMDTVGAEERIAKYEALIAKETDPDKIDAYTITLENIRLKGEQMGQKLKDLRDAYEEFQKSDDPDIANAYDPVIAGCLNELSQSIGNTSLRDMSIEQLSDVYDMYRMVLTRVRDANKTFLNDKKEAISNLASRVVGEVRVAGGDHKYRAAILDPIKKFGWNNLKPVYAFEHIGSSTLSGAFDKVRSGEDIWAKDVTEAREFYLDKSKKYGYDSWDFKKKYRFKSVSEESFELTLEQILSLYAYSKRTQAHDHLKLGGFVFDSNIETHKDKGSKLIKYKVNTADAHQITPEILAGIVGTLTTEQIGFVDEMQGYLSTVMGAKGNEITMQMYGVKLFKEKFYFPLKSAKQFMFEQNEVSGEVRIKNSGFTNKVVAKANNPVILSNFMDVWANHVNDMSMYHAFVLPLEDFNRIFNYNSPKKDGQPPVSVKGTIQNAYTPAAVSYVKQLITDLNCGARTDSTAGIINKMMGLYKKGAVFASASVAIQQPSAIARAAALVDLKYFIGPKVDHKRHKLLWEEVKQYAPVAIIKEMGYFDTNMGKSTQDFITGREYSGIKEKATALVKDSNYRDELLSKAPALADEMAWCSIWEAVKRETKAKNPGMDTKSDAFLQKAGKRFTEVITKTQVYDSVLARSANMRSKDTGMKMATAFMAEPTTAINMVLDALRNGKRGGVEGRRFCRKTIAAVAAAQILNAFLVSWVYAARDDDEEESFTEKYLSSLVSSILDGVNPATYIPFIKDIISIVKGYDVERSDMAVVSDLWNAWQQLKKDDVSAWRKVEGFVGGICQIFGLPVKNIMRDARALYQAYDTIVNGEDTTVAGIKYAVSSETVPNKEQLYRARLEGDAEHEARVEGRYDDEDSANAAVRAAINDSYLADEIDLVTARNHLIKYAGMDVQEAHWLMDAWEYRKNHGSDEGYNKYNDFYEAVQTGNDLEAVIQTYTENGVKKSTLSGQITEQFKQDYVNMSASERQSIKGHLINAYEMCGVEREDAVVKIEIWDWEAEGIEDATEDAVRDYMEWCRPVGIPKATYMDFRKFANSTKNDVGENGKTVNYSAVKKIMAYINELNLTSAQKDALAKSKGWLDKTISEYKLW